MNKFLEFLLSRKKIDEQQARLVQNVMESSTFFGVLALRDNLVTPEQLEKVILEQYHGKNKKIGEILVDEEILSNEEVEKILNKQSTARTSIGRILVDLEILHEEEVLEEQKAFEKSKLNKAD
ncbi:MAG: hypothetical protein ABIH66_13625 [bacterium]